jgi:hypothetical protein
MEINILNRLIESYKWMDFKLESMQNGNLLIWGSKDLTYSHELEFLFEGVTYCQLGMEWTWANNGVPVVETVLPDVFSDRKKMRLIQENYYVVGTKLYRLNECEGQSFYVISEGLEISFTRPK